MPRASVSVVLDQRAINRLVFDVTDRSALRAAGRIRTRARANLTAAGRIRTGALRDSIRATNVFRGVVTEYSVGSSLPYASYQEDGVRGPIYPRRAKVLVFKPKGSNQFVFARKTRGFPGAHYMRDAARTLTVADFLP